MICPLQFHGGPPVSYRNLFAWIRFVHVTDPLLETFPSGVYVPRNTKLMSPTFLYIIDHVIGPLLATVPWSDYVLRSTKFMSPTFL